LRVASETVLPGQICGYMYHLLGSLQLLKGPAIIIALFVV